MTDHTWIKEFPASITVCDEEGIILEMNDKAAKTFESDGGYKLIGSNMLDCHPGLSRQKTERLLAARVNNVYTIEKNGIKKIIQDSPDNDPADSIFKNGRPGSKITAKRQTDKRHIV